MRVVVKRGGNSAAIRIPSNVLTAAKIEIDDQVDIREEQGRVVIDALSPTSYDLAGLIEGITPDNLHDEIDLGRPIGKEKFLTARYAVKPRRSGSQQTRRCGRA